MQNNQKTWRSLKIFAVIFGALHLLALYALFFLSMGNAMARFDGGAGGLSVGTEEIFMKIIAILLFPFGYMRIPLIGPWINSIFWAFFVYWIMKQLLLRKASLWPSTKKINK